MTPERALKLASEAIPRGNQGVPEVAAAILAAVEEDRAARVALPDADRERLAKIREDTASGHGLQDTMRWAVSYGRACDDLRWVIALAENLSAVLGDLLQDKGIDLLIDAAVRRALRERVPDPR